MERGLVIDIGSNSIKSLLAGRAGDGSVATLVHHTIEARISAGIDRAEPRLSAAAQARGLTAIRDLLALAPAGLPRDAICLVATSAVRDALNRAEFMDAVQVATGHRIRLLSGDEEANLIGRGLTCEPELSALENFYAFDIGGGSLECLEFAERRIVRAISLPLGSVRLTEHFVADASQPFTSDVIKAIGATTQAQLRAAGFPTQTLPAIFTGGGMTVSRKVLRPLPDGQEDRGVVTLAVSSIGDLSVKLGALPVAHRIADYGIPAGRADIIPTALTTILAIADHIGTSAFHHTYCNLRWGVAAEMLLARSS